MQLPAVSMEPAELFSSQLAVAYATSTAIKWLKYQKWFPLMQQEAAVLNRMFSAAIAFIAAIGIHYTFDVVQGTLVITGLTIAGVTHGLWAWGEQFALQQGVFKLIVQPEEARQQKIGQLPTTSLTSTGTKGTGDRE